MGRSARVARARATLRSARCSLFLLLLPACADQTVTLPCDVRERACQAAIFAAVAETREQEDARLPQVRVISRAQLLSELRAAFGRDADTRSAAQASLADRTQRGLSLLGLMPEPSEQSADDAYIAQSVASIAAYYSHASHDITVIADQVESRSDATLTLAHEFVHALQDQREGLSRLQQRYARKTDEETALTSLIEGEATWLSYVTYYREVEQVDYRALKHQQAFKSILDKTLKSVRQSDAPLLEASELLPYPLGGEHVAALHVASDLAQLAALFEAPPLTLREYVDNDVGDGLPLAPDCDVSAAPEGYARIHTDRLGFAGLLAFLLAAGQDETAAFQDARAWRGDRLAVYGRALPVAGDLAGPGDGEDDGAVAVSWALRLETPESARRLLAVITSRRSPLSAVASGSSVLITAANDERVLLGAASADRCPPLDKSRARGEDVGLYGLLRRRLGITP
jgi:hypothetical protein